jgi:hypothetical protein
MAGARQIPQVDLDEIVRADGRDEPRGHSASGAFALEGWERLWKPDAQRDPSVWRVMGAVTKRG